METKTVIGVVLCFGVAFSMLAGSGIGAAIFAENPGDHETTRAIDQIACDADVESEDFDGKSGDLHDCPEDEEGDGLSAEVAGDNEPTLVGVAISGGRFAVQLVAAVALLPITLMQLGIPSYAAVPLGGTAQIVALIGLVQFIRGSEYL